MDRHAIARLIFKACGGYVLFAGVLWILFGLTMPVYAPGVLYGVCAAATYISGAFLHIYGWRAHNDG
jgi:hypothetical protein